MLWQIREDGVCKIKFPKSNFSPSVFFAGMAAVNAVFETLKSGDHVVASNQVKEKTRHYLAISKKLENFTEKNYKESGN